MIHDFKEIVFVFTHREGTGEWEQTLYLKLSIKDKDANSVNMELRLYEKDGLVNLQKNCIVVQTSSYSLTFSQSIILANRLSKDINTIEAIDIIEKTIHEHIDWYFDRIKFSNESFDDDVFV